MNRIKKLVHFFTLSLIFTSTVGLGADFQFTRGPGDTIIKGYGDRINATSDSTELLNIVGTIENEHSRFKFKSSDLFQLLAATAEKLPADQLEAFEKRIKNNKKLLNETDQLRLLEFISFRQESVLRRTTTCENTLKKFPAEIVGKSGGLLSSVSDVTNKFFGDAPHLMIDTGSMNAKEAIGDAKNRRSATDESIAGSEVIDGETSRSNELCSKVATNFINQNKDVTLRYLGASMLDVLGSGQGGGASSAR